MPRPTIAAILQRDNEGFVDGLNDLNKRPEAMDYYRIIDRIHTLRGDLYIRASTILQRRIWQMNTTLTSYQRRTKSIGADKRK